MESPASLTTFKEPFPCLSATLLVVLVSGASSLIGGERTNSAAQRNADSQMAFQSACLLPRISARLLILKLLA